MILFSRKKYCLNKIKYIQVELQKYFMENQITMSTFLDMEQYGIG